MIGGFSQGAVMSFAVGLGRGRRGRRRSSRFSGFIPDCRGLGAGHRSRPFPPIAICARHIRPDHLRSTSATLDVTRLVAAGADALYASRRWQHSIDPRVLEELQPWVRAAVEA